MSINPFPWATGAHAKIKELESELPNDQEFGRAVRKYLNEIIYFPSSVELDTQPNPTTEVIRSAMKAVAKDVRVPKAVRDGLVKREK